MLFLEINSHYNSNQNFLLQGCFLIISTSSTIPIIIVDSSIGPKDFLYSLSSFQPTHRERIQLHNYLFGYLLQT